MKGSIGTSLQGKMIIVRERKLKKAELRKLGRVKKRKHRIKVDHPIPRFNCYQEKRT